MYLYKMGEINAPWNCGISIYSHKLKLQLTSTVILLYLQNDSVFSLFRLDIKYLLDNF